jgi:hypothetical protein
MKISLALYSNIKVEGHAEIQELKVKLIGHQIRSII